VRKQLPDAIPQWVADGSWFFITINCVPRGKNQLCRSDIGNAVLAAVKFNHERFVWHCRLCLLMPDHLHAIVAFPREPGMTTTVKNWKKFDAGKHGVDWQRDFFDHRLRDHHELEEKTSYILTNPVRKGCANERKIGCGSIARTTAHRRVVGRAILCTPLLVRTARTGVGALPGTAR